MNIKEQFLNALPTDFVDESKVWIYQTNRLLSDQEQKNINEELLHFTSQWQAHGDPVKGWGQVVLGRFIIMIADETDTHVSGCSTDGMMRVIQSIERQYKLNLFDRLSLMFYHNEKLDVLPLHQLQYALDKGFLKEDDLYFDGSISKFGDLRSRFIVPIYESWLKGQLA